MKIRILTTISFFLVVTLTLMSQCGIPENLIHNCGFELMHSPNLVPTGEAQFHTRSKTKEEIFLKEWRSRAYLYDNPCSAACSAGNIGGGHTPDLYSELTFNHADGGAFNGDNFAGMSDYELIQQKFHQNNKLVDGQTYILRMRIKLAANQPINGVAATDWEDSDLNIYLSKNKIKYKNEEKCEKSCEDNYRSHKSSGDILNALSIKNLNWNTYPLNGGQNGWHTIEFSITAINMSKYDWIAFELTNNIVIDPSCFPARGCNQNYLLLDEILLAPECAVGCEIACSQTDGPININANNKIDGNQLFRITGLDNVTEALIQYYPITGQVPVYSQLYECVNGIGEITWNGANYNGTSVASGTYIWVLSKVKNECGFICDFTEKILVQGNTPQAEIFECENGNIEIPEDCCAEEPDIFIDNVTITGLIPLEMRAFNNINIATQSNSTVIVNNDATATFRAGNAINVGQGFDIVPGAVVEFIIDPCQQNN